MALPTPPLSPILTVQPTPFKPTKHTVTQPSSLSKIPTIKTTSPSPDEHQEDSIDSVPASACALSPPLPPPSPPLSTFSRSPATAPDPSHLRVPTPLSIFEFRGLSPSLGPREVLSDSEISALDLGPAFNRSASPSPEPLILRGSVFDTTPLFLRESAVSGSAKTRTQDNRVDEKVVKRRRVTADSRWYSRDLGLNDMAMGVDVRAGARRRTNSPVDSLLSLDEDDMSEENAVSMERDERDRAIRAAKNKHTGKFAHARVRTSRRRAWHR
ncbi:hypothetical protein BDV12DRAFT_200746 [Aspergillus spectabilis]